MEAARLAATMVDMPVATEVRLDLALVRVEIDD